MVFLLEDEVLGSREHQGFAGSGMSARTVKTGHFLFFYSTGFVYTSITTSKSSKLKSTLNFISIYISAAVVTLDHRLDLGEGNAVPPYHLHAAIDNVFDIGNDRIFPKDTGWSKRPAEGKVGELLVAEGVAESIDKSLHWRDEGEIENNCWLGIQDG
ncbi:hypothetical protein EVAR_82497_1 [Eumeta japonica]|uniref:Uncharacterized protein n=1 Tax=Eumeta variegata TaxID=151549 RepID=A0A4C1UWD9_EUMVA|nr:hypothetical protein EVAR_82497_1 [Eumeta japonica]